MQAVGATTLPAMWGTVPVSVSVAYGPDADARWSWKMEEIWLDIPGYEGEEIRDGLAEHVIQSIYQQIKDDAEYIVERERRKA